jgi:diguanylate cyclase (GGDEF)-like protein
MWTAVPHVKRCLLLHRRSNGNWTPAFAHGVDNPDAWARLVNDFPALARSRRARRFSSLDRYPQLTALGAGVPFFLVPFAWGEDVMALGAVQLDGIASDDIWEGFQVERKLVSIGLRRAFLYDLMSERSRHDGLTGALLRRPFLERVEEALRKRQRYKTSFSLALLDLDKFKAINDKFGHLAGDRVLAHLVQTARRLAVPGVTMGRLGGDEFVFLLEIPSFAETRAWLDRFQDEVRKHPLREGDADIPVAVSIGVAEATGEKVTLEDLFQRADRALYAAKKAGRDRMTVFTGAAGDI